MIASRWSDPGADGTLVPDVKVGTWQMPWNARPDATRFAPGVPPAPFWASDPNGIVKRSGDRFTGLVNRTYRVLLTRGLKGCYVYIEDGTTRSHLLDRHIPHAGTDPARPSS